MVCSFQCSIIVILSILIFATSAFTHEISASSGETDEDYPSDTHGGAVKAFGQLVSDDSGSRPTHGGDDSDESQVDDEDIMDLKLEGFEDIDDGETQYIIEEIYGYTYDEAVDTGVDDDDDE